MTKANIFILACCILMCATHAVGAQRSVVDPSIFQGTVDSVIGSPVRLSDVKYTLTKSASIPGTVRVTGYRIRVDNISGHGIKRLLVSVVWKGGYEVRMSVAVDSLATGEGRDYVIEDAQIGLAAEMKDVTFTVRPTRAEFDDHSHWAAPRTWSETLGVSPFLDSRSGLRLRQWVLIEGANRIAFDVLDPRIVAYRLGTVRDDPDSDFQVSLGKWVELSHLARDERGRYVDSGQSLAGNKMLSKAAAQGTGSDLAPTPESGVAVFVAEVRFDDGRVWSQDTRRDELLWDN